MSDIGVEDFENWVKGFSGCDGGDIGSSSNRSIWVCGIEWAERTDTLETLTCSINRGGFSDVPQGYNSWEEQSVYPYNKMVMKLLAVINGMAVKDYDNYASEKEPFVQGKKGFFKMNLYPIAFERSEQDSWPQGFQELTGCGDKAEYVELCKRERFQAMRELTSKHQPEIVICLGTTYLQDYKEMFPCRADCECVPIGSGNQNRNFYWWLSSHDSLVVVFPLRSSHKSIEKTGKFIREHSDRRG